MTYFLDRDLDAADPFISFDSSAMRQTLLDDVQLLGEKLMIPKCSGGITRPRLLDLLDRSATQFPATLVSGRAGTGKTVMAAAFAQGKDHVAWYTIEPSDVEWNVFANYFATCVLRGVGSSMTSKDFLLTPAKASQASMASFLISVLAEAETMLVHEPILIVLDGIHHLFDAPWFGEFFGLLLSSIPENARLMLLCRSKPPNPLWRMRSKQILNVIDEKILAFDLSETVRLTTTLGLTRSDAERAHSATFGRASKLVQFSQQLLSST